jgi:6,7-dimethyl-8-ribityllumazine synthase
VRTRHELGIQTVEGSTTARGLRIAVVVARVNDFVTDRLRDGALEALTAAGASPQSIVVLPVPGSFEIPLAAHRAAESGAFDAVICLGCVIRGETPHFEYIASAVAHGITAAAVATGVPITFGVLTTNSAEEALARAGAGPGNKGWEAATAAVEMARLFQRLAGAGAEEPAR